LAASGASLALAESGLAQESAGTATPVPETVASFVQFVHFDKFLGSFGVKLAEDQLAALYGVDVQTYRDILAQFAAASRQAAEELLADSDFAARVDQLPFAPEETVVAFGDSLTDDLQSWAEILRQLLTLRRPDDQIAVVNQGVSGDTTADALRRLVPILQTQPAWIVCMLGTNDVMGNGKQATKTLVSLEETELNLAELRHLAATESATTEWAWITAPPCDDEVVAANPFWAAFEISLHSDDLVAIADGLRDEPDPVVDLVALFGQPPAAGLLMEDGVHPALAGQQAIVRALVERLTESG
jgi:lysophospholipase L1-like esterase